MYEVDSAEDGSIVVHVNAPDRVSFVEPPPRPKYIIESVEDGSFRVHVNNPFIELKPVKPARQTVNPRLLLRQQPKNSQSKVSNKSHSKWANSLGDLYQRPTQTTPFRVQNRETSNGTSIQQPALPTVGRQSIVNVPDIDYPSYGLPYHGPNKAAFGGFSSVSPSTSVPSNNNPARALNTSPNASAVAERHSEGMRIAFEDHTPVNSGGLKEAFEGKNLDASAGTVFNEVSDGDDYGSGYSTSGAIPTLVYPSRIAAPRSVSASGDNMFGEDDDVERRKAGNAKFMMERGNYEVPAKGKPASPSYSAAKMPTSRIVSPVIISNPYALPSTHSKPMRVAPNARNMPSVVSASSSIEDRDLLYKSPNMIPSSLSGLPRVAGSTKTVRSMRRPENRPASTRASIRDFNRGQGQHSPTDLGFPLPECYRTATGHMCCNRLLEELIYEAASEMTRVNMNKCNIQKFSQLLANRAEREFQTSFEVIVGVGDFAAKAHFKDNLICKTIVNNKFVLVYATAEVYPVAKGNFVPPISGLIKS